MDSQEYTPSLVDEFPGVKEVITLETKPYIVVKVETGNSECPFALLITPANHEDSNMINRLGRSALIRHRLDTITESNEREVVEYFRFPEVKKANQGIDKNGISYVGSIEEEWIETTPVGSIHLVEKGVFTTEDMRQIAKLFKVVQDIGQEFADSPDFDHFRISVPFSDRNNNKWWIDVKNNDRKAAYEKVFGAGFMDRLVKLVESDETAALFKDNKFLVLGNIIPVKLGKDKDGKIVLLDLERTASTQYKAFDYATFLVTLVSDPDRMKEFFQYALEENHDANFLAHLRRSVLLDRLGNLVDLVKEPDKNAGAIENLKNLALDALNQTGLFEPTQYGFSQEAV
jgi:hypothetical protein